MINAFKNTNTNIVACDFPDILSNYAPFKNLFVVDSDFYFASEELETAQDWRDQIALNNIIPIYDCKQTEPNHDDPIRYTNIQDIEIEIYKGKYRYTLYFNYDLDLYNKINKLHNRPAYIYLQDINNNIISILDGTDDFGIRVELFSVKKLIFGLPDEPSGLKIDLTIDSSQDFNITNVDFNHHNFIYWPILYFEETGGGSPPVTYWIIEDCYFIQYGTSIILGFHVNDSNEDEVITGIVLADVNIVDDLHGSQTIYSVSYDTDHWKLECDKLPTTGYLYIDSLYGIINFNYDISTLYFTNGIAFPPFSEVVVNGYTQEIPDNCEAFSEVTYGYDYIFNKDSSLDIILTIYAGSGTEESSIITLNDNFFTNEAYPLVGFQYYILVKYKSNYATVGSNDVLRIWAIEDDDSINTFINLELENTSEWKYTSGVMTLTYPSDNTYRMRVGVVAFPRQGSDVVLEIESIYLYKYIV